MHREALHACCVMRIVMQQSVAIDACSRDRSAARPSPPGGRAGPAGIFKHSIF
jgi:hypothetical protein